MIPFANRGGCRILDLLGRGGFGPVHKGPHTGLDQSLALKVLFDLGDSEEAGDIKQRFLMEARHNARLWHPNRVTPGTESKCSECGAPMGPRTQG